jgi:dolichol-phosphate mannosyltransferase
MPALNEEANIENAVEKALFAVKKFGIDGEIIVIDDGSTDRTSSIVLSLMNKYKNIKLIKHPRPYGIGYSFMDGIKNSNKDVVVMFPGDNENDPINALEFYSLMGKVDIIVPFIANIEVRSIPRRIISSMYRFIINMSFGVSLNYTNGTVFYRRCIFDDINLYSQGFFYQAELLIKALRRGYLFVEVPNILLKRKVGESKAIKFKSLAYVIKGYLMLVYKIHIKRIESKRDYDKLHQQSISYQKYKNI